MAEIPVHHMVAENYYWLGQVWNLRLLLLKHNLGILVGPSVWQILDCTCTLVNGHVFEQLVLFTFTAGGGWGEEDGKREFCSNFHILVKDVMDPFTDGKHDTHYQIFRLKLEKRKKEEL